MNLLTHQTFYLVGIKGVAMTAIAHCLLDAGKTVLGSDTEEEFVTQPQLDARNIPIDFVFDPSLISPESIDCVIYTAAHGGPANPQVLAAIELGIPTFSHAEALGDLFNAKQGIAVCGVGGKSTTSAMIAWILEKVGQPRPSYAIGVGGIPGLKQTGYWSPESDYFVAEADEYVTDPMAASRGEAITPRFSYLHPSITVCTNLSYDHPDVYRDFAHTKEVYAAFFAGSKQNATLVINGDDQPLVELATDWKTKHQANVLTFGTKSNCDVQLTSFKAEAGKTTSTISINNTTLELELVIPGKFNALNALAAICATAEAGISFETAAEALKDFHSTKRRSERIGTKNGVTYYDDYAHHPNELRHIIGAFNEWYPEQRLVFAFQSHTFSRTKQLFDEFVDALATAKEIVMIDIFPSAREGFDDSISSTILCQAITQKYPHVSAQNLHTLENLAEFCQTQLHAGDVLVTVGAGDIYHVHEMIA